MEYLDSTEVGVSGTGQSSLLAWVHSGDTDLVELAFQARSDTARYWGAYTGSTGDFEVQRTSLRVHVAASTSPTSESAAVERIFSHP